ncbi:hypothetical protein [Lutimonas zeaxanthinifaciens]|uniref:hypothetical protein n=1 Tax=Lutimonas zeaxanthinifaciens TaxID=3060215 RepID=UPI00265D19D2|nr:hypothetical protein [Lutimonas sp. YSD2104]WKK67556.1 hypothetical protein QZH61_07975 [Lutimonas sp. YSD2104]
MKKILPLLLVMILWMSCDKIKSIRDADEKEVIEKEIVPENIIEEKKVVKETHEIVIPDVPLGFLVTYEGKYAAREKLFENEDFASRLKSLDRFNYEALLKNYNTETPVSIVDNVVHMSGCRQHDCPASAYDFFIDLDNDNINIFHFRSNMLRVYQEKGFIELPPAFAKEMEIKKSNAGIGNTETTESKYEL